MSQAGSRLLKIGMTRRTAAERQRDHVLMPCPLVVEYEHPSTSPQRLEVLVHRRLAHVRKLGEFFDVDLATAIEVIQRTALVHSL